MNKRIKKKKSKNTIDKCKKIEALHGGYFEKVWVDKKSIKDIDDDEELNDIKICNQMLFKVVDRCIKERFPIEEYMLFEIPYGDKSGWIMDFVNKDDYYKYHELGMKEIKIREIDFWVTHNGKAIPQKLESSNQYNAKNCFESVYTDRL